MVSTATKSPSIKTLADLLDRLGHVPLERIRFHPYPGMAKEKDVLAAHSGVDRRLCELVCGVLVEKTMGTKESMLAALMVQYLLNYLDVNALGIALGADGMVRLWRGRVRIPDACFISWEKLPAGELPPDTIATVVPDLAIEVLSESNTPQEIAIKIHDFFQAGTRLFWIVDPKTATAQVYTGPSEIQHIGKNGTLDGGDVLPGFSVPLKKLFSRMRKKRS